MIKPAVSLIMAIILEEIVRYNFFPKIGVYGYSITRPQIPDSLN